MTQRAVPEADGAELLFDDHEIGFAHGGPRRQRRAAPDDQGYRRGAVGADLGENGIGVPPGDFVPEQHGVGQSHRKVGAELRDVIGNEGYGVREGFPDDRKKLLPRTGVVYEKQSSRRCQMFSIPARPTPLALVIPPAGY
jgi:hypothetical protein